MVVKPKSILAGYANKYEWYKLRRSNILQRASYPVEELFKLLYEQLHSASFHCSAKSAIEELQESKHCYTVIVSV